MSNFHKAVFLLGFGQLALIASFAFGGMGELAAKSAQVANEKAKRCACYCLPKEAANDE